MPLVPTTARQPWDFQTYWCAARTAAQGGDPYDIVQLSRQLGRPVELPFVYSPITLLVFLPFALLPAGAASVAWLALKAGCLVALLLVWLRSFLPRAPILAVTAALALGFNAAAVWDLEAGNITAIEQLLVWSALAAYVAERRKLFAALIVAASLFKLWPIALLALLLAPSRRSGADIGTAALALAAFAAMVWLPVAAGPSWARLYLHDLPAERTWGIANPSAIGLFDMLLDDNRTPLLHPLSRQFLLWIAYVTALVGLSLPVLWRLLGARDPYLWCLAAAALHTLLSPRPMAYGYLEAVPPALCLGGALLARWGGIGVMAAIVSAQAVIFGGLNVRHFTPWTASTPFLLLLILWLGVSLVGAHAGGLRALRPEASRG